MKRRDASRLLTLGALGLACVLVAGVGVHAAAQVAREARRTALRALDAQLSDDVEVAADRVRDLLRTSQGAPVADVPFPHVVVSARCAQAGAARSPTPFRAAEQAEFVEGDTNRALDAYRMALDDPDLDPSWRAEGLRNVARLEREAGEEDRARLALDNALRIEDADDHAALLVAYDAARFAQGEEARARLREALAAGAYPAAEPSVRSRLLDRLGADVGDVPGLRALAASLGETSPWNRLLALPDGRVAWVLGREGAEYRFAVAARDDVLALALPGFDAGRWRVVASDGTALPRPPFPALAVAPGPAALDAVEGQVSGRRWSILAPALALAALLGLAALVVELDGRRRRALAERRDAFLLSATHELKTPIANVLLYAETLAAHGAEDPEAVGRFACVIEAETRRLERRVREMLLVAAGDEGGAAPATVFDPVPIVERLVAARREQDGALRLDLDVDVGDGTRARGTEPLFASAVDAVLDNACKFGGTQRIAVHVGGDAHAVEVAVLDLGPGIPAADLERVFEPFARLARDVEAATPGTGLGLALARRCARACGGDVVAEAPVEGGTRLRVRFPRANVEEDGRCPAS